MGFKDTLAGSGYVVLNVIRGLNVISLLCAMAASMVLIVKTIIDSSFYVFDGITHALFFCYATFLLISETPFFRSYFERNWPLLGLEHGFITLGLLLVTISMNLLGNLNKDATSANTIGPAFYSLVEAAGILNLICGVANLVADFIFRNRKEGVSARMVRAYGKQASRLVQDSSPVREKYAPSSIYSSRRDSVLPHPNEYHISSPRQVDPERDGEIAQPPPVHPALRGNMF